MSRNRHAYYALSLASLLCALVAVGLGFASADPVAIKSLGVLAALLGIASAYFNARDKREAKEGDRRNKRPD